MRAIALLAVLASPAYAQSLRPEERQDAIGAVIVTNHTTAPTVETTSYTISGVDVVVYYRSTPNAFDGVDPRDVVTITVPEGYVAIPSEVLLPEGETVEVLIYEALLG
jgi:hypothetical protein